VKNENGLSEGGVAHKKIHDTFSTPLLFHKKPDVEGFVVGRAVTFIFELNSTELVNFTTTDSFCVDLKINICVIAKCF